MGFSRRKGQPSAGDAALIERALGTKMWAETQVPYDEVNLDDKDADIVAMVTECFAKASAAAGENAATSLPEVTLVTHGTAGNWPVVRLEGSFAAVTNGMVLLMEDWMKVS